MKKSQKSVIKQFVFNLTAEKMANTIAHPRSIAIVKKPGEGLG
jgi:hypothetical protein